jgi:hypothetical protein
MEVRGEPQMDKYKGIMSDHNYDLSYMLISLMVLFRKF